MPGSWCAVGSCRNSSYRAKKEGRTDLSFHSFPKDPELRTLWILKCSRFGSWNPKTSYLCSDHFKPSDFRRNLRAELMGYKERQRKLRPNAVPTLNIESEYNHTIPDDPEYIPKSARKKLAEAPEVDMQSDDDGCIEPLQFPEVKRKMKKKRKDYVIVDKDILERTIFAVGKLTGEHSLFGELVAHEYRSIKSKALKTKLADDIHKVVQEITEADNRNNGQPIQVD